DDVIYAHEPDALVKPASNTKMFTTAAAFGLLGEDYRIKTQVVGPKPDDKGKVDNLYLMGHHDFTWSTEFYETARFPLDQLAAALHDAGVRRVGTLWARGEFVYNGFRYDEYNPDKHRKESAEAFRDALVAAGIEVEARDVSVELEAPDGVEVLAEWSSMPLHVACTPINRQSHNEFADALVRHLGFVGRGESSYEAGAAEVIAWLEAEGLDI